MATVEAEPAAAPLKLSLERRLYLAHRNAPRPKPKEKEISEAIAFFQKSEKLMFPKQKGGGRMREIVVDVAGSHGLLALLYLIFRRTKEVVVLDPHRPPSFDTMVKAWASFYPPDAVLRYIESPLQSALPSLVNSEKDVVVVACHACQHLSAEVARQCIAACRDFAVMPCCHKDPHGEMKHAAAALQMPLGAVMDVALIGTIQAAGHRASLRTIDPTITPQNRVLIGLCSQTEARTPMSTSLEEREERMEEAYIRAHRNHTGRLAAAVEGKGVSMQGADEGRDEGEQLFLGTRSAAPMGLAAAAVAAATALWFIRCRSRAGPL